MSPAARAVLAVSAFALGACGSSDDGNRVRWTVLAPLPEGASLDAGSVTLRVGTSIAARPSVVDPGGYELPCEVTLSSENADVLRVDASERGSYALTGNTPGKTMLTVECALEELSLAARVTAAR